MEIESLEAPAELGPKSLIQGVLNAGIDPRLYFNIELNGMRLLALLDNGSMHSYLGRGMSKMFQGKYRPEASAVNVANGKSVKIQGLLDVRVTIDSCEQIVPFRLADDLTYECILGIDFKRAFGIRIDFESDTWWTPRGVMYSFYPCGRWLFHSSGRN